MKSKKQHVCRIIAALLIAVLVSLIGIKVYQYSTALRIQSKIEPICELQDIRRIEFKQDELVILEKHGDIWKNIDFPYLDYDQEALEAWVQTLEHAKTSAIIKNVEHEETYGINEQSMMITVFDAQNESETYRVGSVMHNEDQIYIKKNDDNYLSIVPFEEVSIFSEQPNLFVKCDKVLNLNGEFTQIIFKNSEQKTYAMHEKDTTWYLENYYEMPCVIKEEAMLEWLEVLKTLRPTKYIGTFNDLSPYGLEQPAFQMQLGDQTINFGNKQYGSVYICIEGKRDVYCISEEIYTQLIEVDYFDMIDQRVFHYPLDEIQRIDLVNPQGEFTFVVNLPVETQEQIAAPKEESAASKTQEASSLNADNLKKPETNNPLDAEKQVDSPAAMLNDKPLSAVEAEEWLQTIEESIQLEAVLRNPEIEQKEDRVAECTITYQLKSGKIIELELIHYDINYYIMRYNDVVEFAVNKEKAIKLFTSLAKFID